MSALKQKYKDQVIPALTTRFGFKNPMQVPKVVKVSLNMGVGEGSRDIKVLEALRENMKAIAGQHPVITRARKSVSNFKIREGMPIGCMVTLRGERMWSMLERLIVVAIPRIRDFRGLPTKSFDGRGNYTFGLTEQLIFPEVEYDDIPRLHGMDVTIVTTARNDEEGRELLTQLGMPFRK